MGDPAPAVGDQQPSMTEAEIEALRRFFCGEGAFEGREPSPSAYLNTYPASPDRRLRSIAAICAELERRGIVRSRAQLVFVNGAQVVQYYGAARHSQR
jgi:hypothetical protein